MRQRPAPKLRLTGKSTALRLLTSATYDNPPGTRPRGNHPDNPGWPRRRKYVLKLRP